MKIVIKRKDAPTPFAALCNEVNRRMNPPSDIKPFAYDLAVHGLTQSMIGTFLSCERKFRLSSMGLTSGNESGAIIFGNVFHAALEQVQNAIATGAHSSPADIEANMKTIMEALYVLFEEDYQKALPDTREDYEFSYGCIEAMLPIYFHFWANDFFGDAKVDWLFSEREFRFTQDGIPVSGKIDGGFKMSTDKWMLENKTKGTWNEGNLAQVVERDLQVNLYLLALQEIDSERYKGVLYNLIRRPLLKRKKDEKLAAFIARVRADVQERPEWYFSRLLVEVSDEQRAAFKVQLGLIIARIKQWDITAKNNPGMDVETTANCQMVYGACQYLALCSSSLKDYTGLYVREKMFAELGKANETTQAK